MKANIVVDPMFGDGGKGITVDYLCSKSNPYSTIVVRFSGGQQAGHNVVIDNTSHVHSNFASGALRGFNSYFSHHCTIYPVTIARERKVLLEKGGSVDLSVHPLTMVTTPADVAYNRITERKNGHGSCGLGIGATMHRNLKTGYKLYAIDLLHPEFLAVKLDYIFQYYLNLCKDVHESGALCEIYNIERKAFNEALSLIDIRIKDYEHLMQYEEIIFEGSQGVLLDMDHGIFPNVTYANTTSKNALEICKDLGIDDIELYYPTRCYQTRHGAGWMSNNSHVELVNTEHEINHYNQYQKEFRIGELDYDLLNHAIRIDSIYSDGPYLKNLVVTCMDQRPGFVFDNSKLFHSYNNILYSYSADSKTFR